MRTFYLVLLVAAMPLSVAAQKAQELDISGVPAWTDTGIDLNAGDSVLISATGTVHFAGSKENGPDGLARKSKRPSTAVCFSDSTRARTINPKEAFTSPSNERPGPPPQRQRLTLPCPNCSRKYSTKSPR